MESEHQSPGPPLSPWRKTTAELIRPVRFEPPVAPEAPLTPGEKTNYLALLWKHKFWIVAAIFVGALFGAGAAILQTPLYFSATTLDVLPVNEQFMQMGQFDPQAGEVNNMLTQLRVMTSPSQIRRARERISLELPPVTPLNDTLLSRARSRLKLSITEPVEFMRTAIDTAAATSSAKVLGATRLVELSCASPSPEVAAFFANALASEYITLNSEFRSASARSTLQWLQSQIEESQNRYVQSDAKLQDFVKRKGIAFVLDQNTLAESKLRQLQADLSTSQSNRIAKQSQYELIKSSPVDSLPDVLNDDTLNADRSHLNELRQTRATLATKFTAENPKIQSVDAQIASLERTMEQERANVVRRIQNEYEAALRQEKLLSAAYAQQSQSLANQGGEASEYATLKRDTELAKQSYDALLQQYNQAAVSTAVPANNVRVLEPAAPSHDIFKPDPVTSIAEGGVLGACLAGFAIIILELVRVRNRSRVFAAPGRSSPVLNLRELGVIPAFQTQPIELRQSGEAAQITETRWNGIRVRRRSLHDGNGRKGEARNGLIEWSKPSFLAESFRYTVTSILAHQTANERLMLIVTSAGPSEGKTTLVTNLGAASAETGRQVLLVDADLRRPRLHTVFGLEGKVGLAELLQSPIPVEKLDLKDYVQSTNVPGLSVITSGDLNGASIGPVLFSERVSELFLRFRESYGVVLVDSAPALMFSDARLLGRFCDGAILVVRSGVTSREAALAAKRWLTEDGVPILGTILNDWSPVGRNDSQYYHPYGYSASRYK